MILKKRNLMLKNLKNSGQVMLLNAFLVSSIFVIITGVFSLVIYYQVEQTNNFLNSAVALFAADSALEYGLYRYFYDFNCSLNNQTEVVCLESPNISFLNKATATTEYILTDKGNYILVQINGIGYDQNKKTIRYVQNIISLGKN